MMNGVALGLVLTTLVTAGVWSPTPVAEKKNQRREDVVIVKEGHRTVVVEFEKDDGNTRVSISPQEGRGYGDSKLKQKIGDVVEEAKEKFKEASSSLPNVGQGISSPEKEEEVERNGHGYANHMPRVRELVCDAFGKCKHKLGRALGRTKEVVSETAQDAADKVYEVEKGAEDAVGEAVGKVKDTAADKIQDASDVAYKAKEKVKDTGSRTKDAVESGVGEAAEKVKRSASRTKEAVEDRVKETAEQAKQGAGDVIDTTKTIREHVKQNASCEMEDIKGQASETVEDTKKKVKNAAEQVKHGADRAKEKVENTAEQVKHGVDKAKEKEKNSKEILHRCRRVWYRVFASALSPESMDWYLEILHCLGFAVAYGTCTWVTFLSSYVLASALPRQQFAVVQSKIYPVYFKTLAYGVGIALLGHLFSQRKRLSMSSSETFQGFNLLSSLLIILVNSLYLEPQANKVMFERLKWEKEEGRGTHDAATEPSSRTIDAVTDPSGGGGTSRTTTTSAVPDGAATGGERPSKIVRLSETLRKLNSCSSVLNVMTLTGLTWHIVHMAHRLHTAC